jgi:hypothetical protein
MRLFCTLALTDSSTKNGHTTMYISYVNIRQKSENILLH